MHEGEHSSVGCREKSGGRKWHSQTEIWLEKERHSPVPLFQDHCLLVSGTHYSLHSRNLEQNIWRIINKSQEGILNLSPHPEQSVILISYFGNRKKRIQILLFITYQHVPDTSWKCSESQCLHLLYGATMSTAQRIFMRITKKCAWKISTAECYASTASVFSFINKVNNSTHFIRDFVKFDWANIRKVIKTVFGTLWRL